MLTKHITTFLICCSVFVTGVCGILLHQFFHRASHEDEVFGCGNTYAEDLPEMDSTYIDGRAVFMSNCASCHNPLRDATGPALVGIRSFRSQEWICKFLTQPKFKPKDKRAVELYEKYGHVACAKFPQLNCKAIDAALRFCDQHKK